MIGTKDLENALGLVSSRNKKEIAKGIAIAAVIEWESVEFYSKQEKAFDDADTKKFFSFLVGQEKQHLAAVNALKKALEADSKWVEPKLDAGDAPNIFPKKD